MQPTSLKNVLLGPLIVLALLIAALFLQLRWIESRALPGFRIFQRTASGWKRVPAPGGYPERLQVSNGGTVWVRTLSPAGLSRWDGKSWQVHKDAGPVPSTGEEGGEFALDGEHVWTMTKGAVEHWDGQRWRRYSEAVASEGAAIVAGGGEAWMLDGTGRLAHFKGGEWQTQQLVLPGVGWPKNPDDGSLQLARTANGALWLSWEGFWRFDGSNWAPLTTPVDDLRMLGSAGDRVWFSSSAALGSVSMDGKDWETYTLAQVGIADRPAERFFYVNDVAAAGGRTWFATSAGALEFDGSHWLRVPSSENESRGIQKIAAGPDGTLWIIGLSPAASLRTLRYLVRAIVVIPIVMIGVIGWILLRLRRRRLQQHQRVSQAVQHATGEVPEELENAQQKLASPWSGGFATLVLTVGTGFGFVLLRVVWPAAPLWVIPVLALAIHLGITFRQSLVKRKPKPYDPIGPGAPSRYDWEKTWKAVAAAVLVLLLFNLDRLPMLKFLRGYAIWILVLAPGVYSGLMLKLRNGAARRGDYDGALKIIRWFHFYNPSGTEARRLSGHVLLLAGRYREAEDMLRKSLASSHAGESYGRALEYLGDALMEQQRYDEAMRSYEAALQAFPWLRRPYRGMAEMLLRRGQNPQSALDVVEKIVDFAGLSWAQRKRNGRPQDDYWGLKAWALARLGRSSEVAPAIENALRETATNCLPDLATTHYRAGMAMQAVGNQSSAQQHLQKAMELDPQGRRGTLAKATMREPVRA